MVRPLVTPAAETLCAIANDWLRLQARDGLPPPRNDDVRRVLTAVALAAPRAAINCPHLLRFVGTEVRDAVKEELLLIESTGYGRVHRQADKLLPQTCAMAGARCSGPLQVAFMHNAPPAFIRRDGKRGLIFYDGPDLRAGYFRLCHTHHLRYDRVSRLANALVKAPHAREVDVKSVQREQWMSTADAARELGIGTAGVRWLLKDGKLTGVRHETGWRVSVQAVARYRRQRDDKQVA